MSRDLPPLNALRAFEAAARLGSLAAAAAGAFEPLRRTWADLRHPAAAAALVLGCPGSLLARWMIPRMERLAADLPALRLHLAASEATPDPGLSGLDAALLIGTPPWPPGWQVHRLAPERIGPVLGPHHPAHDRLLAAGPAALSAEPLLHTTSRPEAWPEWARRSGMEPDTLRMGTGFEHLYYLLEAAVAGLGVAIAPQELVQADIAAGRLVAPWGFVETGGQWRCAPGAARANRARPRWRSGCGHSSRRDPARACPQSTGRLQQPRPLLKGPD